MPQTYDRRRVRTALLGMIGVLLTSGVLAACGSAAPSSAGSSNQTTWQRIMRTHTVTVGLSNEAPFSEILSNGSLGGEAPSVLEAALKPYGVTHFVGVLTNFDSLIPGLLAGRFDVIAGGMSILPSRCQSIDFGNPEFQNGQALAVVKGNPLNLHSYADVKNNPKAVFGTLQGGQQIQIASTVGIPSSRVLTFPDVQSAITALTEGRVNAVGLPPATLENLLSKLNNPNVELANPFTNPPGGVAYGGMGFLKKDTDFRNAYDAQLAKMEADGQLLQVLETSTANPGPAWDSSDLPPKGLTAAQICAGGGGV